MPLGGGLVVIHTWVAPRAIQEGLDRHADPVPSRSPGRMRSWRTPGLLLAVTMAILSLAGPGAHAQVHVYSPNYHSFDTVTDPRAIAMGESSVADAGDPAAFASNPANLAFVSGRGFYCNYRSFDWFDEDRGIEDWSAWSAGVASAAPLGGMALAFNWRGLSTSDSREYDQTFSLAYAISRGNLAVGGALRFFNRYFYLESHIDPEYEYESSYLPSIDLGVLYHAWGSPDGPQALSIGMALQNYSSEHAFTLTFEGVESKGRSALPLYLRTGFRYALDRSSTGHSPPLRFIATAEHRGIYDPTGEYRPGVSDDDDFGGIGLELTLYRWLSLRTGWINEHGARLDNRLGLGINLSPDGEFLPGEVSFDYALIRVPENVVVESTGFVHSFGLRLSW